MRAGTLLGLVMAGMAAGGCAAVEQPLGPEAPARRPETRPPAGAAAPLARAQEALPADTSRRYGGSLGSGS